MYAPDPAPKREIVEAAPPAVEAVEELELPAAASDHVLRL